MPCMNDISDRSFDMDMDLKEFHLFPKLCADLRIMIVSNYFLGDTSSCSFGFRATES